jgi:hypothetical protein
MHPVRLLLDRLPVVLVEPGQISRSCGAAAVVAPSLAERPEREQPVGLAEAGAARGSSSRLRGTHYALKRRQPSMALARWSKVTVSVHPACRTTPEMPSRLGTDRARPA